MEEDVLIRILVHFSEEHWPGMGEYCREMGYSDEELKKALIELKSRLDP